MRILFLVAISFLIFSCNNNVGEQSDEASTDVQLPYPESAFKTFESTEDGVTYKMKQYYMVTLITGPNRNQSKEEVEKLQASHLAHLNRLATSRHICIVGPTEGNSDIRGFAVYSVPSKEEALRLASLDPMVKAGRLSVDVQPWWAAIGGELF